MQSCLFYPFVILLLALSPSLRAADNTSPPPTVFPAEKLHAMSDAELLGTFVSAGLDAKSADAPSFGANTAQRNYQLLLVREEMRHRGRILVPALMDLLRTEVNTLRPQLPDDQFRPSLRGLEIDTLTHFNDPRAVDVFLEILLLDRSKIPTDQDDTRSMAADALEELTHVSFRQVNGRQGFMFGSLCYRAVELPNGIGQPWIAEQDYSRIATLYRQWLAGPGKDPAQWLPIAQRQARAYLESDNLDAAYCGATFLYAGRDERRDDDPDRTVARLGQIIDGAVKVTGGKPGAYQYQGKPLKDPINLWVELLTNYDARARPWSASLIRFREESNDWRSLEFLTRVGGREIMAYFFESFSKIKQAADPTIRDQAQVDCRSGIDRWAGRTFETDNQRLDWWKSNQDKSPEQWLRDSLLNTARRADIQLEKSEIARASPDAVLFRQLFPDAPYGIDETLPGFHYLNDSGINPLPFREKWFLEHQSEFIYDASAANFRLPKGKQG